MGVVSAERKARRRRGRERADFVLLGEKTTAVLQIVALSLIFHVFRTEPSRFGDVGKLGKSTSC